MSNYKSSHFFIYLKETVESRKTASGKFFDLFIEFMIIGSLVAFSIETIPSINNEIRFYLHIFDVITIIVFTIEYFLRIFVADKKIKYLFSFFGIVDLVAILPFYLQTGIDLRSVRSFRMLRLLRLIKLLRYNSAIHRLQNAFSSIREELLIFFSFTLILLFIASVGIYYFEHEVQPEKFSSVFECMWFAIVSLTTVGYGDMIPITLGGRIFTGIVLFIGLGIVAVPTGLFASALTKQRNSNNNKDKDKDDDELV